MNSVLAVVAEMVPFFTTVTALSPEGVYELPWAFTCDAVGAVDALATTRKYAVPISSSATPIVAESTPTLDVEGYVPSAGSNAGAVTSAVTSVSGDPSVCTLLSRPAPEAELSSCARTYTSYVVSLERFGHSLHARVALAAHAV